MMICAHLSALGIYPQKRQPSLHVHLLHDSPEYDSTPAVALKPVVLRQGCRQFGLSLETLADAGG